MKVQEITITFSDKDDDYEGIYAEAIDQYGDNMADLACTRDDHDPNMWLLSSSTHDHMISEYLLAATQTTAAKKLFAAMIKLARSIPEEN
jgi:hypothetical protein